MEQSHRQRVPTTICSVPGISAMSTSDNNNLPSSYQDYQRRCSVSSPHLPNSTPTLYVPKPHRIHMPPGFLHHSVTSPESPLSDTEFEDSVLGANGDAITLPGNLALTMVSLPVFDASSFTHIILHYLSQRIRDQILIESPSLRPPLSPTPSSFSVSWSPSTVSSLGPMTPLSSDMPSGWENLAHASSEFTPGLQSGPWRDDPWRFYKWEQPLPPLTVASHWVPWRGGWRIAGEDEGSTSSSPLHIPQSSHIVFSWKRMMMCLLLAVQHQTWSVLPFRRVVFV